VKLSIVATPIGNLGDITYRAIETLREADLILCEDTRVTIKLLNRYEIKKPLLSYHQRSKLSRVEKIIEHLEAGKNLALVTDAGTPGISDPGGKLIAELQDYFKEKIEIVSVPGPSALAAAISISGVDLSKFIFLGFPPNKKGRETFFNFVLENKLPVIYYESRYRFIKNLELIKKLNQGDRNINLVVCRELTKKFESVRKGNLEEILEHYQNNLDKVRGEFVVVIH
jgi:16S rRNA (cytidine1402-2'-O)-methyltransferase